MSEKKEKKDKKEETPKLVEVYGSDVREEKVETKNVSEDQDAQKETKDPKKDPSIDVDIVRGKKEKEDKNKTPEEIVKEIVEERQAFKTEVVPFTSESTVRDKGVGGDQDKKGETKKEYFASKEETKKDEIAFDNEIGSQKKAVRGVFGVGALVFLLIFGITGWAFYLKTVWLPKETVSEVMVEVTPNPANAPTPVPTPKLLGRGEITLEILNGSGVTGLAGKNKKLFEDLGYVVDSVGNADSVNESELYVKEDELDKLGQLYEDVLEELSISSPSGYLDEDVGVNVRIVLAD